MAIKTYSYAKDGNKTLSAHFKVKEFASNDSSKLYTDTILIDEQLVTMLEKLFTTMNLSKMIIVSGYRNYTHDKAVGGDGYGQHTKGKAADICCYDKSGKIISAKIVCCVATDIVGFKGCANISSNYHNVHVDTRTTKYYGDEAIHDKYRFNSIWYRNSSHTDFYIHFNLTKAEVLKYVNNSSSNTTTITNNTNNSSNSSSTSYRMETNISPDNITTINGVQVKEYLLTKHNPNHIDMPTSKIKNLLGITVHNTDDLPNIDEDAGRYTLATVNGNMKSVRVHYYVDNLNAWQNLPLDLTSWHAADGSGPGNMRTISIECIMKSSNTSDNDSAKAEDNTARIVAYLLNKYNMTVETNLFTHLHWINVKHGRTGSNTYLNTTQYPGEKYCPTYILPHWTNFCNKVNSYLSLLKGNKPSNNNTTNSSTTNELYRIRKDWNNVSSQIGAYKSLDNAIKEYKTGYYIYDSKGNVVYPTNYSSNLKVGDSVKVKQNALTYTGGKLSSFVYNTVYTIISINNDRVVIGINSVVTAAIKKSDLIKV